MLASLPRRLVREPWPDARPEGCGREINSSTGFGSNPRPAALNRSLTFPSDPMGM